MIFQGLANLLWFVPLGGILVALYMLRMRRKEFRVPATFLWPDQTEEVRANALIQKLKFNWLLVLQLLALAAVILAFARPQFKQNGLTGETTVIVIDASASMNATDVKPTRLGEAKRLATEAINSAKPGDRIALIEAGSVPKVIFPLSHDPVRQELGLKGLLPSDGESDIGESMRLASALVNGISGARILLLSDGCFDKVSDFSPGKAALVYKPIGSESENLAITALGASKTGGGNQLFCSVKNFGVKRNVGTLNIYCDGKIINSIPTDVAPGASLGRTMNAPASASLVTAELKNDDFLQADNFAATVVDPNSKLSVLLVSKGNPFLERALLLDPRVTLDKAASLPGTELGAATSKYDLVVFDRVQEQKVGSRGILTIFGAGPSSPVLTKGKSKPFTFEPLSNEGAISELVKGLDLTGTYIDNAETLTPRGSAKVALASTKGPLIVTTDGPQRQIYVGFDILQSDFPLQVGFPIFVANALDFLSSGSGNSALVVKPSVPFSVQNTGPLKLTNPDKRTELITSEPGVAVVRSIRTAGTFNLQDGKVNRPVLSVVRSDTESKIAPVKSINLGNGIVKATEAPSRFSDFWRPILVATLLLLAVEWYVFARKS